MTTALEAGLFQLNPAASTVAVRHKTMWGLVTVKGAFTSVTGNGEIHPDGTAQGTITLDSASLDTNNAKRDVHLRSNDFFDVGQFPAVVFKVGHATSRNEDTVQVDGELTVRGITRPQSLTAAITRVGTDAVTLTAEFTVDRTEFGLAWNQLGMMRGLTTVNASLHFTRAAG